MWPFFRTLPEQKIRELISKRPGEEKLGERIRFPEADVRLAIADPAVNYVILGIPEDIGVRANGGMGGAHTLWESFLKAFLNVQAQRDIAPEKILILGYFDFSEWMTESEQAPLNRLRQLTAQIDESVAPVIREIVAAGKLPIVIGGGHNNAFPLIKGASECLGAAIHCINLDAHADYRIREGRHSGNGFRYAREEGFLNRYAAIGLHRNYNNETMLRAFETNEQLHASFYDDVVTGKLDFKSLVQAGLGHVAGAPAGLELDMDSIAGVLSSAMTPSGISAADARYYMAACAQRGALAYVHLTEGAALLRDGRTDPTVGKLAAYLITDLLRNLA